MLKSGGYLIIDQTEALTTIDVNTGGFVGARIGLRVPEVALRWIVIVMGTAASIGLFVGG